MKKRIYYWGVLYMVLVAGCKTDNPSLPAAISAPQVCILENEQTDYSLQRFIQVLKDTTPGYTLQDILQPSLQNEFQPYSEYSLPFENYQYYWGKLQVENRLDDAGQFTEWVLSFTGTWTSLDIFIEQEAGSWRREQNGTFILDRLKGFAPTGRGNLVKLFLPPYKTVTVYFRGKSERTAIYPSFYIRLKHIETFYDGLLRTKVGNAFFMGFLLMMFSYNLIVYFLAETAASFSTRLSDHGGGICRLFVGRPGGLAGVICQSSIPGFMKLSPPPGDDVLPGVHSQFPGPGEAVAQMGPSIRIAIFLGFP
ncbi:MAG: hypothetical protein H6558_04490 [Lewinellaceae bacterium]|nr:hypothetical protein [Lewinellaceae bacterium]